MASTRRRGSTRGSILPLTRDDGLSNAQEENAQARIEDDAYEQGVSLLHASSLDDDPQDHIAPGDASDNESTLPAPNVEETKSLWFLTLLTFSMCGLQVAWAVELSSISPFLLELGLSKSLLAFVWIAGPLSGTLVQPYVGIKSDDCRYKRGRRRPFIIGGAVATILSLMMLAWTRETVAGILSIFGAGKHAPAVVTISKIWAVALVYVLDFAINVVQAGIRAFIVDCAPTHQQESANAIAGIITGIGGIIGYLFGEIDLSKTLSFLGHTQFQSLCAIASTVMATTVMVSCIAVQEPDPWTFGPPSYAGDGVLAFFRSVFTSIRDLPIQVKRVCLVQVFAWIGWFPFLFYITTYVGHLHANPEFKSHPDMTEDEINDVFETGTRRGAFALLIYSITSLAASIILPMIVVPTYDEPEKLTKTRMKNGSTSSLGQREDHSPASLRKPSSIRSTGNRWSRVIGAIHVQVPGLTLRRAWLLSHIMFALLMWLTLFVSSTNTATVLIALVGIPWALTNWAPFALIAGEISKRDAIRRGLRPAPPTDEGRLLAHSRADEPAEQAGVVLGIHNVAVSAPQVLSTLVSSVIFMALQKPRGETGDDSVGWVIRFGGACALLAAWFTRNIAEGNDGR